MNIRRRKIAASSKTALVRKWSIQGVCDVAGRQIEFRCRVPKKKIISHTENMPHCMKLWRSV